MTKGQHASVEGVVADDTAVPAQLDQLVARNDRRRRMVESDQHAHDPWLQFAPLAVHVHGELGGMNAHPAKIEIRLVGKVDPRGRRLWPKIIHDRQ